MTHSSAVTLGLLETDTLYADVIDEYGSYGQMFARYFDALDGQLSYRYYQVQAGELPQHPDECSAYLVTGSKAGVYDRLPWLPPLADWIVDFHARGAKIIGICFGHQMVANSLGGQAAKSARGWGLGVHRTKLHLGAFNGDNASENASGDQLRLIHSHQDQVEKLPPGARVLASSDFCPYAAYAIDDRALCFQGHPEFTPEFFRRLFAGRADDLADHALALALATLNEPTDHERVGRWLLDFIRNSPRYRP
jgi:GMP synthase-like glutamine amidotransferase